MAGRPVTSIFPDVTVHLDRALCNLILENALSNAFKHGDPQDPNVQFTIMAESLPMPLLCPIGSPCPAATVRVVLTVSNAADPLQPPLTEEVVKKLLSGEATNVPEQREVKSALSDRIGLSHCLMAAKQGGLTVALWQAEGFVHFQVTVDTILVPVDREPAEIHDSEAPAHQFPPGLSYALIDDSTCAQRLLEFYIRSWCDPAEVHSFGTMEADVALFQETALQHADIVITDQHLQYSQTYLGTDLVRQLLANGFPGLLCIRSGDDSPEDRAKYAESGAHCSFAKDLPGSQLVEELKQAYLQLQLPGPRSCFPPSAPSMQWAVTSPSRLSLNESPCPTPPPRGSAHSSHSLFHASVVPV
eukprot:GGOE01050351.1.p1 GENE.GGOE01050351.1~~GGOE01050351.1.p1  ORF type:complete len:376 (-),score=104.81 GGOE01050351.1:708-1784(-)